MGFPAGLDQPSVDTRPSNGQSTDGCPKASASSPSQIVIVPCLVLDNLGSTIGEPITSREEELLVGLVLVSHSALIADGLRDMVGQVAGDDVPVATAGGTEDGRLGTSAPRIADAIRTTFERGAEATLVLLDLGSAALSLELALEELDPAQRARVRVSNAPLVEGAVLAAVQASVGASLDEVAEAAAGAASMPKLPGS